MFAHMSTKNTITSPTVFVLSSRCYQTLLSQAAIGRNRVLDFGTRENLEELTDGKVVYHVKGLAGHVQVLFHLRTHHGCIEQCEILHPWVSVSKAIPIKPNSKICMNQTCGHQVQAAWLDK